MEIKKNKTDAIKHAKQNKTGHVLIKKEASFTIATPISHTK